MQPDDLIAFVTRAERPELEILINFGVFAGREATPAELDELAHRLLPELGEVTVVGEQRHALGEDAEAAVHLVRVSVEDAPVDDADALAERLRDIAAAWAEECIAERHAEVSEI